MIEDDDSEAIDVLDEIESAEAKLYQQLGLDSVRRSVEEYDFEAALLQFANVQKNLQQKEEESPVEIVDNSIDWPAIQQQLSRLQSMIDDDDSEAIDVLHEIESAQARVYQQLGLASVRNSVEEYDFEAASVQFTTVQEKLEELSA